MLNGYELRRIRQLNGITQAQLANVLGIYNRKIIDIEGCHRELSEEDYAKWMNALYSEETKQASRKKISTSKDMKEYQKETGNKTTKMNKKKRLT